jgi:hypothetical protein
VDAVLTDKVFGREVASLALTFLQKVPQVPLKEKAPVVKEGSGYDLLVI